MEEVRLLRPCTSFEGFLAECNIKIDIPFDILCSTLKFCEVKDLKFSRELGIMRFNFKNRGIMIFRDNKIRVNNVKNRNDAKILIKNLEDTIRSNLFF